MIEPNRIFYNARVGRAVLCAPLCETDGSRHSRRARKCAPGLRVRRQFEAVIKSPRWSSPIQLAARVGCLRACIALIFASVLSARAEPQPKLKDVYKDCFLIGAALNRAQIFEEDAKGAAIVKVQFNTITPENILKWEAVHPRPDGYDFEAADRYVAFGESNGMFIVGHNLVWHSQTPRWVFQDASGKPLDREALLARMREHIHTVVGRYKGKIRGWDVVNEALNDNGTLRRSPWLQSIGEDYLLKAYEFAHEADPGAELYYNDYGLENAAKRQGALALIRSLRSQGARIAGVGLQGHYKLARPTEEEVEQTIRAFEQLQVKVMITELDVSVLPTASQYQGADVNANFEPSAKINPYTNGLPDSVQQQLAKRYASLFAVFLKHRDSVKRVTFWGVADGGSWLNDWPVRKRTDYPLLFDRDYVAKPAFEAVAKSVKQ